MEPELIMRTMLKENYVEALIGVAVVALAIWFTFFAWGRTGGGAAANGIAVTALFPSAAGVTVGTDVRVAGMKVGTVSAERLDPKSYQAEVTLSLDPSVKLPADSSAAISSEGLLGVTYVAMSPGGDPTPLKNGDIIVDTQGALDLMSIIGSFVNRSGSGPSGGAPAGGAAPATP